MKNRDEELSEVKREFAFYPGCTLHSTGVEYGRSTEAVCEKLDIELIEIDDWNCCGASSAHSLDMELADALPARSILLAQQIGLDIAIPCAACYGRLSSATTRLIRDEAFRSKMEATTGARFENRGRPRALLEIITSELSEEELRGEVRHPLTGLRPVSYYGCLLLRPPETAGRWDSTEHPVKLDRLLNTLGAVAHEWSYATDCCGASMTLNRSDLVIELVGRLVAGAEEAGANCIITACPLCQANLDGRQRKERGRMPVFYFTELLSLAMGVGEIEKLLSKHVVDPRPMLRQIGLL